jgi:hypothetical protein
VGAADRGTAWAAGLGVMAVAVTAAVISFEHVRTLALRNGETEMTSWLLPFSVDGAVVAAVAVLLADSRAGRRPAALSMALLAAGLAGSLAANIASAEPHAAARAVAAWPPLALALGVEVLTGMFRRTRTGSPPAPKAGHTRKHAAPGSLGSGESYGTSPTPSTVRTEPTPRPAESTPNTAPGQVPGADVEAVGVIRQLDAAAAGGKASRLEIQRALGCGGSRAVRLAAIARGTHGSRD